jgi:pyruvate dehydrogenase phosphatase
LQENILRTNRVPRRLETPPYLIATPEVINHQLSVGDRFIVIASDGLWDMLTPDSVVRLLADHWHGRRTSVAAATGVVTADDIEQVLMSVNLGGRVSLCARERIQKCTQHSADDPTPPAPPAANVATPTPPVDSNAATHVIRHALGGMRPSTQYDRLFTQLRMPAKQAREYRDDMTVQVIYFNEEYIGAHRNHK